MKKLLAMVLALVMTLSLAVSANAFKDDKSISDDYAEAVAVLNGMGVFKGYEDNSFKPQGDITRAEVSAIVYRVYTQDVKDAKASMYATYNKFSDMAGAGWAQGYIGYCANAELVKGYPDGTFKPSGKVTGYEVLAMILRAVGYDKNGEFSGADWALHVAQTAQQAGVLKNVKGIDLNAPATRELVAELLFRAIAEASTVTYTPAFGYVTDKVLGNAAPTLGYKNFKLEGKADADVFGRPATKWIYNVGDKSTLVVAKADASYTTKVAECDIAKDLGISTSKTIEGAYIDGTSYEKNLTSPDVTTNQYATINPLATTSYVGAQGRVTEVYAMANGAYRLVEINTYLAKVTNITPAKTDKNGHVVDAYSTLTVYADNATAGVVTADTQNLKADTAAYSIGSYVLVTMNAADKKLGYVSSIEEAKSTAVGAMTGFSGTRVEGTTTFGTVAYTDSDKYSYGWAKTLDNTKAYDAYLDTYGNLIGLVESSKSYLIIEAIRWVDDNTVTGGAAKANIVLVDGTELSDVTIAYVGAIAAQNVDNQAGDPNNGSVSDSNTLNGAYQNHLYSYSVNADGSYNITKHAGTVAKDASRVTISNGVVVFENNGKVNTNDNTVFFVKDLLTGKYTKYEGKNSVPAMTGADVCYLVGANGYASVVVVYNYKLASNSFVAYVQHGTVSTVETINNVQYYTYNVYKLGETEPTKVYYRTNSIFSNVGSVDGFRVFTVSTNNVVESVTPVVLSSSTVNTDYTTAIDANTYVKTSPSIDTLGNTLVTATKNYALDNATIMLLNYDATAQTLSITTGVKENLVKDKTIYVVYNDASDNDAASYVYVVMNDDSDINDPTVVNSINVYGNRPVAGVQLGTLTVKSVTGATGPVDTSKVSCDAKWYDRTAGAYVDSTTIALVDHQYTVVVTDVVAADGYVLGPTFTVEGFTSTVPGTWTYNF